MDGILSEDQDSLKERVFSLESKVQLQGDEVICLKSALSDALRRINILESAKATPSLPSMPTIKHKGSSVKDSNSTRSPATHNPRSINGSHSFRATSPTSQHKTIIEINSKKMTSHNDGNSNAPVGRGIKIKDLKQTSVDASHKDSTFIPAEGCLKFFLRGRPLNFYAPTRLGSDFLNQPNHPPKENLALEWVYGYRGKDARSNIYQLPTGEIVYFIAAVAVLYNPEEQTQRHYIGHTDDIKCIAIHPDKVTIATGQVAGHDKNEGKPTKKGDHHHDPKTTGLPHIRIWNSISLATLKIIGIGDFERAVACIGFSKMDGGNFLVAVDDGNDHTLSVWDWQKSEKGAKILETKSSTEAVLLAEYHPFDSNSILTCGKGQITFWTIDGLTISKKLGIFEKHEKPKFVTCLAFTDNGDVLSGDSSGTIFVWIKGSHKVSYGLTGAHEGGVFCLCLLKDGSLISGGKDRKIVKWQLQDGTFKRSLQETELSESLGPIRMLSESNGNLILVGTTKNAILQGSHDLGFNPIMQSHIEELWGLAAIPGQNQFITCGMDKLLYLWDSLTHRTVWAKEMPDTCFCVAVHSNGLIATVSSNSTRWFVLDLSSHEIIATHSDSSERIECMEFSPDGSFLACGSRDNFIYIYSVSEDGHKFNKIAKCSGHSSFVLHIDWSLDGQYLQSNSGDYEILFWNMATYKQITSPTSLRDVQWATNNCTLSFNSCGIWPEGADGTDINNCSRSNKQNLIASADDFGKVTIYNYPCYHPKSMGNAYLGHSSHVTNVRFLPDDSRLISIGGKDASVMQWQIVDQSSI